MGQHKYNPNCQLAAEGKLPPKPKKMSKRQQERFLMKPEKFATCSLTVVLWRDVQVGAFALSGRMVVIPTLAHAVAKKLMKIRCKSFEGKTHKEVAFRK